MPKLTIDGKEIEVPAGISLIQACDMAGVEIPRFCFHERLSIAGNCRMCLVEMEKAPKPVASCALPVAEGMIIKTNTPMVQKARQGVMEFLLINHPLDCPICDQAGECDLQDQAMAYGFDRSRYDENKRAVEDKYMGPLIKTHMTRCIHCTRCVRFVDEVAGVPDIGALGRGENMEITTYLEKAVGSELSANVIDLCPVGALTSKPYAFEARPWELDKTESIDVLDAVGSHIRIDSRGNEVMRILPRLKEDINEEWISDKTRYACDGLNKQRLDRPYVRVKGNLQKANWDEALKTVADKLKVTKPKKVAALVGDLADCESIALLKNLMTSIGTPHMDCREPGADYDASQRASYIFNTTIEGIESADAILLVGTNPRVEAAILNARILKRTRMSKLPVGMIGPKADLGYGYDHLGVDPSVLVDLVDGKGAFAEALKAAQKPMIVIGSHVLTRDDADAILNLAHKLCSKYKVIQPEWNGFNVLQRVASRVGALDLGFVPGEGGYATAKILSAAEKGDIDVLYLLGVDEIDLRKVAKNTFIIYQGHHGDAAAHLADVILPGAAYTEKDATYVNLEGRVQQTYKAVSAPGEAKEDWRIIRALSEALNMTLLVETLDDVRASLQRTNPIFALNNQIQMAKWPRQAFGSEGKVKKDAFTYPIANFYMTDPISRHSPTMAACVREFIASPSKKVA